MQIKRDSLLLRIIFYNDIAIIFSSFLLTLVFSLIVFNTLEQRLADNAREKVVLLYKAYMMEAKNSKELMEDVTESVFQLAGEEEESRSYYDKVAENIRLQLMRHSSKIFEKSRVVLLNSSGILLGDNRIAGGYQLSDSDYLSKWKKNLQKKTDVYPYRQGEELYFRFVLAHENRNLRKKIYILLDVPVEAYPLDYLREFIGLEGEDKLLLTMDGKYLYGDLPYKVGEVLLTGFQRARMSTKGFAYSFNQKKMDGTHYYLAYYKILDVEEEEIANVGVAISKEKFLSTKYLVSVWMIILVLALIIISTTLSANVFTKLLRPLNSILDAAYDIGRGNYNIDLEEEDIYEIRNLAHAIEKLAKNISHKERQLVASNEHLSKSLQRIDAIQKIVMGLNLEKNIQRGMEGILSALTSEAGLGYSRAIYFEYQRDKNLLLAKKYALNPNLLSEYSEGKESLKAFSFQFEELDKIIPLLKTPCFNSNYLGKSVNENKIIFQNGKGFDYPFGNDLFHSLGLENFIILPLCVSENMKSCILMDYYLRDRKVSQEEIELLSLLLLNLNIQFSNKEGEERKVYTERMLTIEKMSKHFLQDREDFLRRVDRSIDKMEKTGYNEKIIAEESIKWKKEFRRFAWKQNSLEDFSHFSKSKFEMISVEQFMRDLGKYVEKYMKKYEINFSQFISASSYLFIDVKKMRQLFIELLKNAAEAVLARNRIDKKINMVVIEDQKTNQVFITVSDNGIGMYPEEVEELNRAYQNQGQNHSMGLGLSIVSTVVKEHGADLYISSKLDEGSDIKIILNIYKGEQQ